MDKIEEIINRIDSNQKRESKNLFLKYLKKWPWFVLMGIIGLGIGFFYYKYSPNKYQVDSRILIKDSEGSMNSVLAFNQSSAQLRNQKLNIENQIGILKSYTLFNKAITNLNWDYTWYQKELLYNRELYNNDPMNLTIPPNAINARNILIEIIPQNEEQYIITAEGITDINGYRQEFEFEEFVTFDQPFTNEFFNFTLSKGNASVDENETYFLKFNSAHSLTSQYLNRTNVELENMNSELILISLEGTNPLKDADFINELTEVFVQFGMENENQNSEKSAEFIDDQLSRIKKNLATAEENFSDYRQSNKVMNLGQEAQLVYQKLEEIENQQYLTQLQLDYFEELIQYLDDSEKIAEMVNPSVVGINDATLNSILAKLTELYSRREELSYSVQEKNPKLILLDKEIKIARDGLEENVQNQLEATQSKMQSLNQRFDEAQARLSRLPNTEKEVVSLQRDFDLNNELYTYMLQKKAESDIAKASVAPKVQVIDAALPEASVKTGPNLVKLAGAGFMGGVTLTFMGIILLGFFNTKIETREEIEKWSTLPVLEGIVKHKYRSNLPVIHHPRSGIAESFRGLKSNINALTDKPGSKVVSINSLVPGEGKSFISSNFSVVLTKTNAKVLLIGADLHKPTLHQFLKVKETFGLSDYLSGEKRIEDIIHSTSIQNLSFIQAGTILENPSDLLDNEKLGLLIDRTRKMFDYIIIDNAPLLLVPDAISTSKFSDVSLFVLRLNHSHKEQTKQINKVADFNKIKHAAIVVNGTADRGYGYGKKYWKKGYGEYKQNMSIA